MNIKHSFFLPDWPLDYPHATTCSNLNPGMSSSQKTPSKTPKTQRLLVSNYDVVANLYGGRVQIVNELWTQFWGTRQQLGFHSCLQPGDHVLHRHQWQHLH